MESLTTGPELENSQGQQRPSFSCFTTSAVTSNSDIEPPESAEWPKSTMPGTNGGKVVRKVDRKRATVSAFQLLDSRLVTLHGVKPRLDV